MPVSLPVEFLEFIITLKLTDDAAVMETQPHFAAYVLPMVQLLFFKRQNFKDFTSPVLRYDLKHFQGLGENPNRHDIGIGVVVESRLTGIRIGFMIFIWSHNAQDFITVKLRIIRCNTGPEASDLQNHLGTVKRQEFQILSSLIILADIIYYGRVYMTLISGIIRNPSAGLGIQMDFLGFLPAIASALPGIHGSFIACIFCRGPSLVQTAVAVHQEGSGNFRNPEI